MNAIKEAAKAQGTGLRGAGRIGSLLAQPTPMEIGEYDVAQRVTIEYSEPGEHMVELDGGQQRPATLQCGELYPYSVEELSEKKGTEYSAGKVVHIFRGHLKPGTHMRDGPGSFHYAGGEVFEGRWKGNARSGLGALYLPSGYAYEGHWKNDRPHGHGVETFPFGEKYVGEFVDGRPEGFGVMYYVDNGSRYEGRWEGGEKHGRGAILYDNGDLFQGEWVRGKREGRGVITYASSKRSYASTWRRDSCERRMEFLLPAEVPEVKRAAGIPSSVLAVATPLGTDLRTFRVVPDLWTEVHPAHFTRIKQAFEQLDQSASGEIEMEYLRSIWDPNNMDTLATLDRAAATVGADDTLELIEVLTGLYPHLPNSETRRWVLTDLPIEYLWRLRGELAEVKSSRLDGFYTLTQGRPALTRRHLNHQVSKGAVGGVKVSRAMFVRNRVLNGLVDAGTVGGSSMAMHTKSSGADGLHTSGAVDSMTFTQMLSQVFPNLWKEFNLRCELTEIPDFALAGYLESFERLDEHKTGYLSIEAMKVAQKRLQSAIAAGNQSIVQPSNSYERNVRRSIFKHQARWLVGDISLTITFAKQVDSRSKTGFLSLAEVLRYAFPNVPCLYTKERLGVVMKSDDLCRCCICKFCSGSRFTMPRPPNPYVDGILSW